ncbi:MAG: hypothetical protein L0Z62_45340 [Gemmataceae bacterium]|nr:hypothetical protein [Gemmataceae bacterium]
MFRVHLWLAVLVLAFLALVGGPAISQQKPAEDYTKVDPQKLGVKPVAATKDPTTGFAVGGKNATELIRKLTEINGRKIADLEKDMRPGKLSGAGFLGKDERLLNVMADDNVLVVEKLGLTHQELARHLHIVGAIGLQHYAEEAKAGSKPTAREFLYHGKRFKVKVECTRGKQPSPFEDGTSSGCNAAVENLGNGKKLAYGLLVPYMIERYGFYEGKGTPYRVEPRAVVELFDFLKPAGAR